MIITFPVQELVSPHFSVGFHEAKVSNIKKCTGFIEYSLYAFSLQIISSTSFVTHDIFMQISQ